MPSYFCICGWECGLFGEPLPLNTSTSVPTTVGSVALETSIVRTGVNSLKLTPASGANGYWDAQSGNGFTNPYYRFYLRVTTLPGSTRAIFGGNGQFCNLKLTSTGALILANGATTLITSSTLLTDTSKWYRVEMRVESGNQELKIDGSSQGTNTATGSVVVRMRFGADDTVSATYTAYVDDFAVATDTYPGDGKAVLLVPISDNARDTLWTGGVGGTSNLYDAVNNLPPTGTASETDSTQIEHAGGAGGTTDKYDANMTMYSTAGIQSYDTINAVQPYIIHGEDAATGTKLLKFEVLSNPVVSATSNITAGNNAGALGTVPTNWGNYKATPVNAPSVTVDTSPVMRVTRPETATGVASVCFMGIYVDYSPGVAPGGPPIGSLALLGVGA